MFVFRWGEIEIDLGLFLDIFPSRISVHFCLLYFFVGGAGRAVAVFEDKNSFLHFFLHDDDVVIVHIFSPSRSSFWQ